MFIDKVDGMFQCPTRIVAAPRHQITNADNLRILRLDGIIELYVAVGIVVERIVLVTYLDILQVKRFGMTGCRTLATPFRRDISIAVFYQVKCFLNIFTDVLIVVSPVVAHADICHKHRCGADVLAVLQIFVYALTVADHVAPSVVPQRYAFLLRAYRIFPQIATFTIEVSAPHALHVASARETQELWLNVGQHLTDILAHAVLAVVECRREQTHHVDRRLHLAAKYQVETS